jgi:hypothetical protein
MCYQTKRGAESMMLSMPHGQRVTDPMIRLHPQTSLQTLQACLQALPEVPQELELELRELMANSPMQRVYLQMSLMM